MKYKQILAAGALTLSSAMAFSVANVHAAYFNLQSITNLDDLVACLEGTEATVCELERNIIPEDHITITAVSAVTPSGEDVEKVLRLNGYTLGDPATQEQSYLTIYNSGHLSIADGASSHVNYGGRVYAQIYNNKNLDIYGGTFYGPLIGSPTDKAEGFKTHIISGTFVGYVSVYTGDYGRGILEIDDGSFESYVSSSGRDVNTTIKGGYFQRDVSLRGEFNEISGGYFNDTIFGGDANSTVEISGGTFSDMNFISYNEGSSLKISGGTFSKGFSVGVEHLDITGGKFMNGTSGDGGWLALILEHPDTQDYSITGGEFVNTKDEYGYLMAIKTNNKPTEASIRKLFEGGNVLNGMWIKLDDSDDGSHWSYIMKQKTDGDEATDKAPAKTPDTGVSTMNGDNMVATSITALIASILAGSLALGAITRFGLHKKISFNKK